MTVKEAIEKLKLMNPDAVLVKSISDHQYFKVRPVESKAVLEGRHILYEYFGEELDTGNRNDIKVIDVVVME